MITTHFDNLGDFRAPSIVIDMPYPVRKGEYVEFNDGENYEVLNTTWMITAGKPVELFVRMR
ncbi:hypothetical protein SEA_MAKAI_83 [Arthrobacter phage Makai]|nr:hypothetical protein SEA_MAKAI_83 [Arthrobacter phage Makai]